MMVGALLLLFVGIPGAIYLANSVNGYLSANPEYTQIDNTTAFIDEPFLADDIDTIYHYAAVNDTTITEETPSWNTVGEWDSVTLTINETRAKMIFNVNLTVKELLETDYSALRMKFNCSKEIAVNVYAVKSDGVLITKVLAKAIPHITNESTTVLWNFTPSQILALQTSLGPDLTDEVWFTIEIVGYDADYLLTLGDTIEFQFAWAGSAAVYSFTSWQILTGVAVIAGIILILVAFGSTSYWNPLTGSRSRSSGGSRRSYRRRKNRRN